MKTDRLKNIEISLIAGLLIALLLGASAAFAGNCDELRSQVLRLHILANSDQPADQQIKLEVRDAILAEYGEELAAYASEDDARRGAGELLGAIEQTASQAIQACGRSEPVRAQVVNMYFDTRSYGDLTMPAGRYDAVRITIGEARGHNWWCVLYPPVCVSSAADLSELREQTVAGENPKLEPRFKLVEWWERLTSGREPEEPAREAENAPDMGRKVDNRIQEKEVDN